MTKNNAFAARTCIVVVVVTKNSIWRRISPKRGNKIAVMLTCVLMWLGRRLAARVICLSFQIDHRSRTFTISTTTSTTGRHLGFGREHNYHTDFRACYVILHKVYSSIVVLFCNQCIYLCIFMFHRQERARKLSSRCND